LGGEFEGYRRVIFGRVSMLMEVIVSLIKLVSRIRERIIYHLKNVAVLTRTDGE
jgi:hypothetical protein